MNKSRFTVDSPAVKSVVEWVNHAADLVLLSILWTVCALPVVTLGVASAALYHTTVKVLVKEQGSVFSTFVQSVRDSWRQALPVGAVLSLVYAALILLARNILFSGVAGMGLPFTALIVLLLHLSLVQLHLYSLMGHYVLTGRELLSLVVRLTASHFFKNVALLILFLCAVVAALLYPPLVLFILPAGYARIAAMLQPSMYARLIRTADDEGDMDSEDEER